MRVCRMFNTLHVPYFRYNCLLLAERIDEAPGKRDNDV